MVALYSREDYRDALLSLLPRGRVWSKDEGSTQYRLMSGLAPTFERLDARAQFLLFDAFPANSVELLEEWERTLGLPDPCEGEGQSIEQRRAQVVVKMFEGGGQSVPYYLRVLDRLGYTNATINEFAPFRADCDVADTPLYGEDWAHVWEIRLPDFRIFHFEADVSTAGDFLESYGDEAVFCLIAAIQPAHTFVIFS
ncbi:MAG: DUF2313 domain-containing protein [Phenylobacterium sp.]|nr:DUF2313 domain-containing protein [Phenylobacterium sp.]